MTTRNALGTQFWLIVLVVNLIGLTTPIKILTIMVVHITLIIHGLVDRRMHKQ